MNKRNIILLHLAFWLYKFVWGPVVGGMVKNGKLEPLSYYLDPLVLSELIIYSATFYINYFFIMPRYYKSGQIGKAWLGWIFLMGFFILSRYGVEEVLYKYLFGTSNYFEGTSSIYYIYDNLYFGGPLIVMSILFWILNDNLSRQKERYILLGEKKSAELSFLRNQVNPHFIFNTLNNIYSLVSAGSQKALPAISKLSGLMRYMYKDNAEEKVLLAEELEYIDSFLELQRIRLVHPEVVQYTVEGNAADYKIAPLLIIPFIENIFKHGIITNDRHPISISIRIDDGLLKLNTTNAINTLNKDEASGIGLSNVKKRLNLLYEHRYEMSSFIKDDNYYSSLSLQLDESKYLK